jgi:hypothetical protein
MLGLKLRPEFLTSQMTGTQIELDNVVKARSVDEVLTITYPTTDIRNALRAVGAADPRPIVNVGERGRGKSHTLGVIHYAFKEPPRVQEWANKWGKDLGDKALETLTLPTGFTPISVNMGNHEYPTLWDPLFTQLKNGPFYSGRFKQSDVPVPSRSLVEQALTEQPVAFILDELQTWFEALPGDLTGGSPRALAFNFIQILAEIAASQPNLLRLIVSVRNSDTEAYRQVHRNNPVLIDFKGVNARQDRLKLIQYRLFENYDVIPPANIEAAVRTYADERVRLLYPLATGPVRDELRREVADAWPMAPELVDLLEDEILMAQAAQETRDLMRILVLMFKARDGLVPLLTPADIDVAEGSASASELAGKVDTLANDGSRLREVAQRNLEAVRESGLSVPHADELISALWARSFAHDRPQGGATAAQLHLDITRLTVVDDNAFDSELPLLQANSFNIWQVGDRYIFRRDENPRAKVQASARNDRLFAGGRDVEYLQRAIAQALSPMDSATAAISKLVVLGPDWETTPWDRVVAEQLPATWREPVVVVLPETPPDVRLAEWLKVHVSANRNLVRFLLPGSGRASPYADPELVRLARCAYLANEWRSDRQYERLADDFGTQLRNGLVRLFERVAVIERWDYTRPTDSHFAMASISPTAKESTLKLVDEVVIRDLFEADAYRDHVLSSAARKRNAFEIIGELREPPSSSSKLAIPYLGETQLYERILRLAARGEVCLDVKGTLLTRSSASEDVDSAYARIRGPAFVTGTYLRDVTVLLPGAAPIMPTTPTITVPLPSMTVPTGGIATAATTANPPATSGGVTPIDGVATSIRTGAAAAPTVRTLRSAGARAPINLQGDLYSWALPESTQATVRISAEGVAPSILKDLLKRLPSGMKFSLEVDVPEREASDSGAGRNS